MRVLGRLVGIRSFDGFVPEGWADAELREDPRGERATGFAPLLFGEDAGEVPGVGPEQSRGGVHRDPPLGNCLGGLDRSAVHEEASYCLVAAMSSGRSMTHCLVTAIAPVRSCVRPRITKLAPGWEGFGRRLRHAVETRCAQWGVSENEIARRAGIDSGAFSRAKTGRPGTGANTVMLLARALFVRVVYLLDGTEPSGLSEYRRDPGPPADLEDERDATG